MHGILSIFALVAPLTALAAAVPAPRANDNDELAACYDNGGQLGIISPAPQQAITAGEVSQQETLLCFSFLDAAL